IFEFSIVSLTRGWGTGVERMAAWVALAGPCCASACSSAAPPPQIDDTCIRCSDASKPPIDPPSDGGTTASDADTWTGSRRMVKGMIGTMRPPAFVPLSNQDLLLAAAAVHYPFNNFDYVAPYVPGAGFAFSNLPVSESFAMIVDVDKGNAIVNSIFPAVV